MAKASNVFYLLTGGGEEELKIKKKAKEYLDSLGLEKYNKFIQDQFSVYEKLTDTKDDPSNILRYFYLVFNESIKGKNDDFFAEYFLSKFNIELDKIENLNVNNIIQLIDSKAEPSEQPNAVVSPNEKPALIHVEITGTSMMDRLKVFLPILNNLCVKSGIELVGAKGDYPDTIVGMTKRILETILNNNIFIIYNGKYKSEYSDEQPDEDQEVPAQPVDQLAAQIEQIQIVPDSAGTNKKYNKVDSKSNTNTNTIINPNSDLFKNKYLKYKQKYLALKAQLNL